jgi:hypothetical protein
VVIDSRAELSRPPPLRYTVGTLNLDATLILCPLGSPSRDLGAIAFASRHAFFKAELLGMHEVPHRVVVDLQATAGNDATYSEIAVPPPRAWESREYGLPIPCGPGNPRSIQAKPIPL